MEKIDDFRGKYFFLSNFYNAKVKYEGVTYLNTEAAFQAMKCRDISKRDQFKNLNPSEAKRLGRRRDIGLRSDWEKVKTQFMYEIVKAKFEQNLELKEKLIQTGDAHLEEGNTWGDKIWGTVNGLGENRLGKILMQVREELR